MNIDLQAFCSKDERRKDINAAWSYDGYSFGTNGHIAIRVPQRDEIPLNDKAPYIVILWEKADVMTGEALDIPELPEEIFNKCSECEGTGFVDSCPDCEGTGIIEWTVGKHEYEDDCKECDGTGKVKGNREPCEKCGGTGNVRSVIPVQVGEARYDRAYLALIKGLPHSKIYPSITKEECREMKPSIFTFDGGDGLIMPLR